MLTQKENTDLGDKKRRTGSSFLDKRSFLVTPAKTDIKRQADMKTAIDNATLQTSLEEHAEKQDAAARLQQEQQTISTTGQYLPSQTGAQLKLSGERFLAFKTLLGKDSPMGKLAAQHGKKIDPHNELQNKDEKEIIEKIFSSPSKKR